MQNKTDIKNIDTTALEWTFAGMHGDYFLQQTLDHWDECALCVSGAKRYISERLMINATATLG